MMIAQQRFGRILVYGRPVDMRNGFDGLEAVVRAASGRCWRDKPQRTSSPN